MGRNWLLEQIKESSKKTDSWPKWKRNAVQEEYLIRSGKINETPKPAGFDVRRKSVR